MEQSHDDFKGVVEKWNEKKEIAYSYPHFLNQEEVREISEKLIRSSDELEIFKKYANKYLK